MSFNEQIDQALAAAYPHNTSAQRRAIRERLIEINAIGVDATGALYVRDERRLAKHAGALIPHLTPEPTGNSDEARTRRAYLKELRFQTLADLRESTPDGKGAALAALQAMTPLPSTASHQDRVERSIERERLIRLAGLEGTL